MQAALLVLVYDSQIGRCVRDTWSAEKKYGLWNFLAQGDSCVVCLCFLDPDAGSIAGEHEMSISSQRSSTAHTAHTAHSAYTHSGHDGRTDAGVLEPGPEVLRVVSVSTATAATPFFFFLRW